MKKIILAFTMLFICFSLSAQDGKGEGNVRSTSFKVTAQNIPELKVYPNPCKGNKITLELSHQELSEIKITNITGKEVFFKKLIIPETKKQIQLDNLRDGLYLIRIKTTENKVVAKKLMKTSN